MFSFCLHLKKKIQLVYHFKDEKVLNVSYSLSHTFEKDSAIEIKTK